MAIGSRPRRVSREAAIVAVTADQRRIDPRFGGCAMCALVELVDEEENSAIVAESRHAIAVLARYAVRRGHVLVVLRRHIERFEDLSLREWAGAQRLAWEAARAVECALGASRVYVASLGSTVQRAMTFPHHHLHVVPTYRGDARDRPASVFTWQRGVVMQKGAAGEGLAAVIRDAWPTVRASSGMRSAR
jgi:diadenosine tetraphosphate (Ap4A) HIT family hydrolase